MERNYAAETLRGCAAAYRKGLVRGLDEWRDRNIGHDGNAGLVDFAVKYIKKNNGVASRRVFHIGKDLQKEILDAYFNQEVL